MTATIGTSVGIGAGPGGTISTRMAIGLGWLILSTAACTWAASAMTTALSCGDSGMKITSTIGGSMDLIENSAMATGTGGLTRMPPGRRTGGSMTTGGASITPNWSWTDPGNCVNQCIHVVLLCSW